MTIKELTIDKVTSAYSGQDGKCCCGCKGTHHKATGETTKNGLRQVRRIFDIVKTAAEKNAGDVEDLGNCFSTVIGNRLYIVYID